MNYSNMTKQQLLEYCSKHNIKVNKSAKKYDIINTIIEFSEQQPVPIEQSYKMTKEEATTKGEPWVDIVKLNIDENNLNEGSIELDWNDIFIARLVKAGYQGKNDVALVDQWFQNICRHVLMETWEQEQANVPSRFHNIKQINDRYSEIS